MNLSILAADPQFKKDLIRFFAIGSIFYVLCAFIPVGYLHPDQHFQTLEFANAKLDPTHEYRMSWEYRSKMRPWTQPYIYLAVLRGLEAIGIEKPFVQDAIIRLASGLVGIAALLLFCISMAHWLPNPAQRRWLAITFGLFWFFPYHFTRTSSEAASSVMLLLAISAVVLLRDRPQNKLLSPIDHGPVSGPIDFSMRSITLSAICLGLMFNMRYQMGFVIVAFALWMWLIQKAAFRHMLLFGAVVSATVAIGLWIDMLGYGQFVLTPWNYLRANLVEGRALNFGSEPWYYYILLMFIIPMGPALLAGTVLFWVRYPKNLVTWITLLFILVHMTLSHKELRFLAPLAPLFLAGMLFVIPQKWFSSRERWIRWVFNFFIATNCLALIAVSVRPPRPAIAVHQYIRSIEPGHFEFYSLGATPYRLHQTGGPGFQFYAPEKVTHHTLGSTAELPAVLRKSSPVYFYHPDYKLPDTPEFRPVVDSCELIYRSVNPAWERWDIGNWLERLATSSIYRCDG